MQNIAAYATLLSMPLTNGELARATRERLGKTRKELEQFGLSGRTIFEIERGQKEVRLRSIHTYERALGLDLGSLIADSSATEHHGLWDALRRLGPFHHYHATMKGNRRFWYYVRLDFSQDLGPGIGGAEAHICFEDIDVYIPMRGEVMGTDLFIRNEPGQSSVVIHYGLFPFFAESHISGSDRNPSRRMVLHGLSYHRNWNTNPEFGPCLLSVHPLLEREDGPLGRTDAKRLYDIWTEKMMSTPINLGFDGVFLQLPAVVDLRPKGGGLSEDTK